MSAAIVGAALLCLLPGCTLPGCADAFPCEDTTHFSTTGVPPRLVLLPDQDSIELRLLVQLTEQGAASERADLLMHGARLVFQVQPGSFTDPFEIEAARLRRADGSGLVQSVRGGSQLLTMENVLSGCAGAGCSAELVGVVDLQESSGRRVIELAMWLEVDARNCEDTWGDLIADVESVEIGGLDAGLPVDGGIPVDSGDDGSLDAGSVAGPPMLRCTGAGAVPAPAEPQCSPEEAACYRACADEACRLGCIDAAVPPQTCLPCVEGQSFDCSLEVCLDESNAWDCCVWSRCVDLPPALVCEPCAAELAAMEACTSSEAFLMYCAPRVAACFPSP